ncbi:MAG TPA: amino acid permease, partial [Sumerlaeia bacterium]|nr:amino acid permease [Sumerlaeia bacterium]
SGDLKDPARAIPRGTLAAVGVGFLVYLAQIVLCGGAFARDDLIREPYGTLFRNALLGTGFLVTAGVFAATLSSAISSYLGAPRILQALSRDPILAFLRPFGRGTGKDKEPRSALVIVGVITFAVLIWAGSETGGRALNVVASVITMFFLYTYGMTNLAAFVEGFGGNPSFRPRFKFFHWSAALAGALACLAAAVLIHWIAAAAAILLVSALYWVVRMQGLRATFGDARRGFVYSSIRRNLLKLAEMDVHPKNWRPTVLVFSGKPRSRDTLVNYAAWMESGRGILLFADVLEGSLEDFGPRLPTRVQQLREYCEEKGIEAFPHVVVAEDVDQGISMLLQAASVGPIRPNLAVLGWASEAERGPALMAHCRTARAMKMSVVLLHDGGLPLGAGPKRIDLWWRGRKNGGLMLILAHLLTQNYELADAEVRILRQIQNEEGRQPAHKALSELIQAARVRANPQILVSERSFVEILQAHSADAACVMLGFEIPDKQDEEEWRRRYAQFLNGMPTTIVVHSIGEEDLLA